VVEAQRHWGLTTMVVSWCLVEMIRYPFYLLQQLRITPPAFLGWLRYSAFYILYPTGGGSEALLLYLALPWFKATKWGTITLPNSHNFGWDMHLLLAIFCAAPPHDDVPHDGSAGSVLQEATRSGCCCGDKEARVMGVETSSKLHWGEQSEQVKRQCAAERP